jgi:hypothetical protein
MAFSAALGSHRARRRGRTSLGSVGLVTLSTGKAHTIEQLTKLAYTEATSSSFC